MIQDLNTLELLHRIEVLERINEDMQNRLEHHTGQIQTMTEQQTQTQQFASQNFLTNGDIDLSRNFYLYDTDWAE